MGSLEKRIKALEGRCGMNVPDPEARERRMEERRAEIRAKLQRVIDQEGLDPCRLRALEELQESVERRRRGA